MLYIWIWIIASILLTLFFLRRRIRFEHYIWMLLPIDMYGISLFGFTVKPYMIFSVFIALRHLRTNRGKLYVGGGYRIAGFVLCFLALMINLFNNSQLSSVMASVMTLVVLACALLYVSNIFGTYEDIPEIIIATAIGYGIVYVIAYIVLSLGIEFPGVCALSRMDTGIFMRFNNMYEGSFIQTYRLRGFSIDPNVVIGTFAPAVVVALPKILLRKANWRSCLALVLSVVVVFLTSSRMALIVLIIITAFSVIGVFQKMPKEKRGFYAAMAVLCITAMMIIAVASGISDYIATRMFGSYINRSGLSDEYGRFSIWKEAWEVLKSRNLLLGIGTGQLQNYSAHGLAAHNTWLEWLCGCGIFVGSGMVLFFFGSALWLWKRSRGIDVLDNDFFVSQVLTLGTISVVIALISVDNTTNSYLWFLCYTGQSLFDLHNNTERIVL